jgi:predicted transcriptional regulator
MRTLVLSIHHGFAERIYSGEKTAELRSVLPASPALRPGDRIALYETKPVSMVTGELAVGEAGIRALREWEIPKIAKKACVPAAYVREHLRIRVYPSQLRCAKEIGVIRIERPRRFEKARPLSDYGLARAPQSWAWAKREPAAPKEAE